MGNQSETINRILEDPRLNLNWVERIPKSPWSLLKESPRNPNPRKSKSKSWSKSKKRRSIQVLSVPLKQSQLLGFSMFGFLIFFGEFYWRIVPSFLRILFQNILIFFSFSIRDSLELSWNWDPFKGFWQFLTGFLWDSPVGFPEWILRMDSIPPMTLLDDLIADWTQYDSIRDHWWLTAAGDGRWGFDIFPVGGMTVRQRCLSRRIPVSFFFFWGGGGNRSLINECLMRLTFNSAWISSEFVSRVTDSWICSDSN